eukprot:166337-Rhodomonas_salina.1
MSLPPPLFGDAFEALFQVFNDDQFSDTLGSPTIFSDNWAKIGEAIYRGNIDALKTYIQDDMGISISKHGFDLDYHLKELQEAFTTPRYTKMIGKFNTLLADPIWHDEENKAVHEYYEQEKKRLMGQLQQIDHAYKGLEDTISRATKNSTYQHVRNEACAAYITAVAKKDKIYNSILQLRLTMAQELAEIKALPGLGMPVSAVIASARAR